MPEWTPVIEGADEETKSLKSCPPLQKKGQRDEESDYDRIKRANSLSNPCLQQDSKGSLV